MVVVNAQPAAKVDMRQRNARVLDRGHQVQHAVHSVEIGRHLGDLRANVAVNANDLQPVK